MTYASHKMSVTPCPYGMKLKGSEYGPLEGNTIKAGSTACRGCRFCLGIDGKAKVVNCFMENTSPAPHSGEL